MFCRTARSSVACFVVPVEAVSYLSNLKNIKKQRQLLGTPSTFGNGCRMCIEGGIQMQP